MVRKDKYCGFVKIYLLRPQLYGEKLSVPAKSTLVNVHMRKKNKTELRDIIFTQCSTSFVTYSRL